MKPRWGVGATMIGLGKAARLLGGEVVNGQIRCPGPGHSPKDRSLSVKIMLDGKVVVHSFADDDQLECLKYAEDKLGIAFKSNGSKGAHNARRAESEIERAVMAAASTHPAGVTTIFTYRDADGAGYAQVHRTPDKNFWQKHWDGGQWVKGKHPNGKIPYRLPELLAADPALPVHICEGEKKTDRLAGCGLVATCASEGAGKWTQELNESFRGRTVIILPDNDGPGRKHAQQVAQNLHGIAASVKIVELPGIGEGEDIYDWLEAGNLPENIASLAERVPVWGPQSVEIESDTGTLIVTVRAEIVDAAFTFLGDMQASAPKELIKRLLPADGVTLLGGQSTAGKTFIEICMAMCLASGAEFFGHRITERVGTVFVAAEGRSLIHNRFIAAKQYVGITENLPIGWIKQLPDFSSVEGIKLFIAQLRAINERFLGDFGVRLGQFCVDTVAATFGMKSEDDNSEATKVCDVLRFIADETGTLANAVHHFGKNPESGLRGASAFRGSADVILGALADIDISGRASNRELVCAKARDGEQGPISAFDLRFVELGLDEDGEPYGSCAVLPIEGEARSRAKALSKGDRALMAAIAETFDGLSRFIVPRAGMPPVKAVKVADLRAEFSRRYVVAETEPVKVLNAKRMAYKRAIDKLPISEFGAGEAEGVDWIWKLGT
jgi:AAA domain